MKNHHSNLIKKLIDYNKQNAKNIKEEDKLNFPLFVIEFPSFKKSEVKYIFLIIQVNMETNLEKNKLHFEFEDEVNIYADMDIIRKIPKINNFEIKQQ